MMYLEVVGQLDADQTVVLSSGLGGSARFWEPQLSSLTERYRVVLYDQLGTGRSPAELPEGYAITDMADELCTALDNAGIDDFHFIGHALGGHIGLTLALQHPQRLRSLVVINGWHRLSPHTQRCFSVRRNILDKIGAAAYIEAQALFLYPPTWIDQNADQLADEDAQMLNHFPPADNLRRRLDAVQAFAMNDEQLAQIEAPTLLIANRDDVLVPWTCSQQLEQRLPRARLELMEAGGHASSVTQAEHTNALLVEHLTRFQGATA
ncbi:pyrimidine utilization protein D [Saccharospirillum sp. MSK14-1]|uniref:pyrimidine utilization protein D n=1 Tax=Saccharospirillum sp. MSK14-1 TaxID=1897632 RepID=UPI001E35D40E|nr:pyrimidine utilization protein D [Saccharospirillum sp. MSK14-1]